MSIIDLRLSTHTKLTPLKLDFNQIVLLRMKLNRSKEIPIERCIRQKYLLFRTFFNIYSVVIHSETRTGIKISGEHAILLMMKAGS